MCDKRIRDQLESTFHRNQREMKVNLDNILEFIIPMNEFTLKWRFTEANYDILPLPHLSQLKPLNTEASNFLWNHIMDSNIHSSFPFQENFFKTIEVTSCELGSEFEVKKWLYRRGIPFTEQCYLSWQPDDGMIVPWKLFVKYFDSFYYYGDQLTIIDKEMNWSIIFNENKLFFGTNKEYELRA